MESHETTSARDAAHQMPKVLQDAVSQMIRVASAVVALLSAKPRASCPASQVQELLQYRGESILLQSVREIFSGKAWQQLWKEVLVKGSATEQLLPEIQAFEDAFVDPDFNDEQMLVRDCDNLAIFRPKVRPRVLHGMETALVRILHRMAQQMLDKQGKETTMTLFDQVMKGLGLFSDKQSLSLMGRLGKMESKIGFALVQEEIRSLLKVYPQDKTQADLLPDNTEPFPEGPLTALTQVLSKGKDVKLEQAERSGIEIAVFWHFKKVVSSFRAAGQQDTTGMVGRYIMSSCGSVFAASS